ncbi:MAG: aromatic ring-hydroxylating oxygenase subunit alpha [Acetobacteraceae bacterium]
MPEALADRAAASRPWPPGLTRVPYWVYQDPDVLEAEQTRLFQGPVWNYLCLEAEIPAPGDWRTTFAGRMPVVVVRTETGALAAFENRCAHRGALICLDTAGRGAKGFTCVYHAWRYDLCGVPQSVAFGRGIDGKGGMADSFRLAEHGPRRLRVASFCGLVFGTLDPVLAPFEDWIGPEIAARVRRVLRRPVEVIGRYTQALPNNWKLYVENVKDTYHASLLHLFFATFRITRLSQGGGVVVSASGGHHVSATRMPAPASAPASPRADASYQGLRSEDQQFRLRDPRLLEVADEWGDDIQLQILCLFPGFVLQQIHNSVAVRQVLPRGVAETDLHWTLLGFVDDPPDLRARRLRQANLVGPAGFVSMEDGCVGGFVQRGAAAAGEQMSVIEMGGTEADTQDTRATEASVRGFWKQWRATMGI